MQPDHVTLLLKTFQWLPTSLKFQPSAWLTEPCMSGPLHSLHFPPCSLLPSHIGLLLASWTFRLIPTWRLGTTSLLFFPDHCMTVLALLFRYRRLLLERTFLTFPLGVALLPLSHTSPYFTLPHSTYHCQLYGIYVCLLVCYCLSLFTRSFHECGDLILFAVYLQGLEQCLTSSSYLMNNSRVDLNYVACLFVTSTYVSELLLLFFC